MKHEHKPGKGAIMKAWKKALRTVLEFQKEQAGLLLRIACFGNMSLIENTPAQDNAGRRDINVLYR